MFVLIVGGGKVGSHLASLLMEGGHTIRVIESRPDVLMKLHRELPAEVINPGDGTDPARLEQSGIRKANVLAAVTGSDEANLVITTLARFEFGVPRIIARVNSPRNAWLFTPDMGVDVALNQADLMAKMIAEEMSLGDMMTLLKLRKGEVELVEEKIAQTATVNGKRIRDVAWPPDCTIAAVIRKGAVITPRGDTLLEAFDEVLAIVRTAQREALAALLGRPSA
ncbi:MAG TPA: TrkA family potassium uptake protein [Anaerolineae bacterium]|nr:TrkA family potassium uptake protein [Anaerolineae bacterium]